LSDRQGKGLPTTTSQPDTTELGSDTLLVARHGQAFYKFGYLLTGNRQDAEDLAQGALTTLLTLDLEKVISPAAYGRRVMLNQYRSLGRRSVAYARALVRLGPLSVSASGGEDDFATHDAIWRALSCLSSRQRAAVVLRYYENYDDSRIGEVLGCAPGTVRSLISRAIPRLRQQLEADDVQHESRPDRSSLNE